MTIDNAKHKIIYQQDELIYGQHIAELVGVLLHEERRKRNHTIFQISQYTKLSAKTIDEVEIARCTPHWQAIARLLKYYNKSFKISLESNDRD